MGITRKALKDLLQLTGKAPSPLGQWFHVMDSMDTQAHVIAHTADSPVGPSDAGYRGNGSRIHSPLVLCHKLLDGNGVGFVARCSKCTDVVYEGAVKFDDRELEEVIADWERHRIHVTVKLEGSTLNVTTEHGRKFFLQRQ